MHVALHGNFSGPVCSTDLVKVSNFSYQSGLGKPRFEKTSGFFGIFS